MKKLLITLLFLPAFVGMVKAQVGYNYAQYDFGVAGAMTIKTNSDFLTTQKKPAAKLNFTYNYSPYINYLVEFEAGSLSGDSVRFTPGVHFADNFTALSFRLQVQAGEFLDYSGSALNNVLKNFYASAGIGVIYTDNKFFFADTLATQKKTSNIMIPLKVGYEFKLYNSYDEPWLKIDLGYQLNYALSDQLDGYVSGNNRDSFGQVVVGLKFALGGTTSYRKQISW